VAFSEKSLDDYVDVAQRIADFRQLYPTGTLRPWNPAQPWELKQVQGWEKNGDLVTQTFIVVVAAAYRTPEDTEPGVGMAWEIFPGRTPYTRGSELMNAETSAWGRAIVAVLASDSKRGVASREEVAARRAEREDGLPVNRDGSLSRSQTSDEQKAAAGVMTSGQQAEHSVLRAGADGRLPAAERGRVTRVRAPYPTEITTEDGTVSEVRTGVVDNPSVDMWTGPAPEEKPGSISDGQLRTLGKLFGDAGKRDRAAKLAVVSEVAGREVLTSKQLSMIEADAVIRHLEKAKEAAK